MGPADDARGTPRWRHPAVLACGGLLVLAGGGVAVSGATGATKDPPHALRAWALDAPALPVPVETPDAATTTTAAASAGRTGSRGARAGDGGGDASTGTAAPKATRPDTLPSGAPTDAEVNAELQRALKSSSSTTAGGRSLVSSATLNADGTATIPPDAPSRVAAIIQAGNEVARKPYVYGGGHGRVAGEIWSDSAYDCSGSISYTLAAAGMIDSPMTSGALADWGEPGPGKWVTIYANGGHTFMYVAGLRFDTSGRQVTGSRWQTATRSTAGFTVVHPKGL